MQPLPRDPSFQTLGTTCPSFSEMLPFLDLDCVPRL